MEEESNMSTFNISVLDETSVAPIMLGRRQTALLQLNSFQLHFMVVCHTMTSIPKVNLTKMISTSVGRFACWG